MTSESLPPVPAPSRRAVVAAVGAAGLAVALTACGSNDKTSGSSTVGAAGTELAKTADIPEGGGKILPDQGLVVTQPTAGTFKAFSSKCTHQGCPVTGISNGVITCPCHHSEFSIADGSVKKGPAPQPLPAQNITVSGDSIKIA